MVFTKKILFQKFFCILLLLLLGKNGYSQKGEITSHYPGEIQIPRLKFHVKTKISNYNPEHHYWVAIAKVKGTENPENWDEKNWEEIIRLFQKRENKKSSYKREDGLKLQKLVGRWAPKEFWPKYNVKDEVYEGDLYDGGKNPLETP